LKGKIYRCNNDHILEWSLFRSIDLAFQDLGLYPSEIVLSALTFIRQGSSTKHNDLFGL